VGRFSCANGQKQRLCKTKAETSSPTVSIESLALSCLIDAMENQDVGTWDIPAAFMQAEIDEEVHIKFKQEFVYLLISVNESYSGCVTYEKQKKVVCSVEQGPVWHGASITLVLAEIVRFTCG
jgi:hypothetical protein